MKKIILSTTCSLLLLASIFSFKFSNDPISIGSELPKGDLLMQDMNSKMISMKSQAGKQGLLVMFSCNTCPYVIKNQELTKEICSYAMTNGIGVILLNSNEGNRNDEDSPQAMKEYAKDQDYQWPYVIDKNNIVAEVFGAKRTPECFLFNKDLKLVYHGAINDNPSQPGNVKREHLKEAINEMTSGNSVSINVTRSVGCSIKKI